MQRGCQLRQEYQEAQFGRIANSKVIASTNSKVVAKRIGKAVYLWPNLILWDRSKADVQRIEIWLLSDVATAYVSKKYSDISGAENCLLCRDGDGEVRDQL